MTLTQLAIIAIAAWCASVAVATLLAWILLRGGRGAEADRASEEWTDEMRRRDRRLFRAARREELSIYREAAIAIRGPTSKAEREVAEVLERKRF